MRQNSMLTATSASSAIQRPVRMRPVRMRSHCDFALKSPRVSASRVSSAARRTRSIKSTARRSAPDPSDTAVFSCAAAAASIEATGRRITTSDMHGARRFVDVRASFKHGQRRVVVWSRTGARRKSKVGATMGKSFRRRAARPGAERAG